MAIKCGHCKDKHDTVAEVRECARQVSTLQPEAQKYLSDLLSQFDVKLAGGKTPGTVDRQTGKKVLDSLIDARRLKASGREWSLPDGTVHDPKAKTSIRVKRPTRRRRSGDAGD